MPAHLPPKCLAILLAASGCLLLCGCIPIGARASTQFANRAATDPLSRPAGATLPLATAAHPPMADRCMR